jgi:Alpha/beta hydrolase family
VATFVLLHGAYHAGWHFHLLVRELAARGHQALAPDLPCEDATAGAERYATVVAPLLDVVDEGIVVVGHSLAGLFIPLLPARNPRVRHLVYLAALLPEPGVSFDDQQRRDPTAFSHYQPRNEAIGNPDGSASCPEARALEVFFHDCPRDLGIEVAAHLRRQYWRHTQETTPLARWPNLRSDYILCRADRALNPEWSRRVAHERLGVAPIEIEGGHSPFLARPAELAGILVAGG